MGLSLFPNSSLQEYLPKVACNDRTIQKNSRKFDFLPSNYETKSVWYIPSNAKRDNVRRESAENKADHNTLSNKRVEDPIIVSKNKS
jgi:hypothetical protein